MEAAAHLDQKKKTNHLWGAPRRMKLYVQDLLRASWNEMCSGHLGHTAHILDGFK